MEAYKEASREHIELSNALHADVSFCVERLKQENTPFWRRVYARTLVASFEGLLFNLRQVALTIGPLRGVEFSRDELALLREERHSLDSRGRPRTRTQFLRLDAGLRFSMSMFARAHTKEFEADCEGQGWEDYKKAIEIRNRISHPKFVAEIEISSEEMNAMFRGGGWFLEQNSLLLSASVLD